MEVKNILIARTDSIGDVMLTLPMAGLLKKYYPNSQVYFLGTTYTKDVIACDENITGFFNWDEWKNLNQKSITQSIANLQISHLIYALPEKMVMQHLQQLPIRYKVAVNRRWYSFFYANTLVSFSRKNSLLHEAQLNCKLLEALGINEIPSLDEISTLSKFKVNHSFHFENFGLAKTEKFKLILHPKSQGSAKEWGLENFQKLIKSLPENRFKIYITGSENEKKLIGDILQLPGKDVENVCGKFSLNEFVQFIASCDGLLAASTGPLHIAAFSGIHAIGLYSSLKPIFPQRWSPIGQKAYFFTADDQQESADKNRQILNISVNDVANYLIQLI
jgi:ADP-heptose:LPS heptosyltransferase